MAFTEFPSLAADAPPVSDAKAPAPHMTMEILTDAGQRPEADFIGTQMQILTKNEILYEVIDRLGLTQKFAPPDQPRAQIAQDLRRTLAIQSVANTGLVEVQCTYPDPALAAKIANTVAYVYKERRIKDLKTNVAHTLEELKSEIDNQEERTKKLYEKAVALRKKFGLQDAIAEPFGAAGAPSHNVTLATFDQLFAEQAARTDRVTIRANRLKELEPAEFLSALPVLQIEDPVLTRSATLLQDATAEESRLLGLGTKEDDATLRAVRAQADFHRKGMADRIAGLRHGLDLAVKIEEQSLVALQTRQDEARHQKMEAPEIPADYIAAKSAYLQSRAVLESMQQRYLTSRMENDLSIQPIKLWELAEPPHP